MGGCWASRLALVPALRVFVCKGQVLGDQLRSSGVSECLRVVLNLGCLFDTCDECKYRGDNRSVLCVNMVT